MGFIVASVLVVSNITNTKEFAYFFLFITKCKKCIKAKVEITSQRVKKQKQNNCTNIQMQIPLFDHNMGARRSE